MACAQIYETVREEEGPYIKMFDLRAKCHACNVYGRMSKSVLPYLLAIRAPPKGSNVPRISRRPPPICWIQSTRPYLNVALALWQTPSRAPCT